MSMAETTATFMAMKGSGYYSKATAGARDTINRATHLVLEAIERMPIADGQTPLRVADFGAADGGTSVDMWRCALAELRKKAPQRPIEICYTDLPRNDFAQLFRMIHGQTEIVSYYKQFDNLYVFASGTSFHEAIFPPRSLNLGFSATASHYLSRTPQTISDHVHMVGASGPERDAFIDQGRYDWENMLLARSRELCDGARLCLFNFGIDEAGRYLGSTGGVSMFDTFNLLWSGLVDDGIITSEEYVNTNFPQCYRTIDQFVVPLTDTSNPVYKTGLRLEHIETRVVRCPYARDFEQHGDAGRFAHAYVPTLRSWSEPTFSAGLSPSRAPSERNNIIDEFYGRYERLVAANPRGHGMDYVHVYLTCALIA
jgi:SAM dependent carboxyl methyltransferase